MVLYLDGFSAEKAEVETVHFPLPPGNTVYMSLTLGLRRVQYFWRPVLQLPGVVSREVEEVPMTSEHETVKYCLT